MDRLTEYDCIGGVMVGDLKSGMDERKAFDRLARYEDTGLTPEEIKRMKLREKDPYICTVMGVRPEQVFLWRGYPLKVNKDGTVCKRMNGDLWLGLEGPIVCDLINNTKEIMRTVSKEAQTNPPLTLEELLAMDGEPAWCVQLWDRWEDFEPHWFIVHAYLFQESDSESYGRDWLAYRRKPEEGTT